MTNNHTIGSHAVQFYEDEAAAMETVGQFLALGLVGKDAIIVIATPEHRAAIEQSLVNYDLDPVQAKKQGWYLSLDAADTLSLFMDKEHPNKERFESVIGNAIKGAAANSHSGKVQAYGEMVALLCQRGSPAAAITLEEHWNDLGKKLSFSLFCSYPMSVIMETRNVHIAQIYSQHTGVIAHEHKTVVGRSKN